MRSHWSPCEWRSTRPRPFTAATRSSRRPGAARSRVMRCNVSPRIEGAGGSWARHPGAQGKAESLIASATRVIRAKYRSVGERARSGQVPLLEPRDDGVLVAVAGPARAGGLPVLTESTGSTLQHVVVAARERPDGQIGVHAAPDRVS